MDNRFPVEAVRNESDDHFKRPENSIDKAITDIVRYAQRKIDRAFNVPENKVERFHFPMVIATLAVNLCLNLLVHTISKDGKTPEIRLHLIHGFIQGLTSMLLNGWSVMEDGIQHRDQQH